MNDNRVATRDDVADVLNGMLPELKRLAPQWFSAERVLALVLAARQTTPAIKECSAASIVGFMQKCATTGLEPVGAGGCWPVPFRNKNTGQKELTFIPDYRGLIFLGKKNMVLNHAYADVVKENDHFEIEKGDQPRCIHKPALRNRGETIGAYAVVVLPDGTKQIEWMDMDELQKVRNSSKAKDVGPWVDWTEEQYKKTVLKRALKPFAGGNPQMQTAINLDNEALGLETTRAPIAEPKAAENVEVGDARPSTQTSEAAPSGHTEDAPIGAIVLGSYSEKIGQNKRGPWTKFSCKGNDGKWYATFDAKTGAKMKDMQGKPVHVKVEKADQYGITISDIKLAVTEAKEPQQEPTEQTEPPRRTREPGEDDDLEMFMENK